MLWSGQRFFQLDDKILPEGDVQSEGYNDDNAIKYLEQESAYINIYTSYKPTSRGPYRKVWTNAQWL
jgi:hypothetical protein